MQRHPASIPAQYSCHSTPLRSTSLHTCSSCKPFYAVLDARCMPGHAGHGAHCLKERETLGHSSAWCFAGIKVRGPAERIAQVHKCLNVSTCLQNKIGCPRLKCSANTQMHNSLYDTNLISTLLMRSPMMRQCTTHKTSSFPWPNSSCFSFCTAAPVC